MTSFRAALVETLRHHLESEDCRYVGNDLITFLHNDPREQAADRQQLQHLRVPSVADFERANGTFVEAQVRQKSYLYGLLADEPSRQTLLTIAAYMLLGRLFVRFPYFRPDTPQRIADLSAACLCRDEDQETVCKYNDPRFANLALPLLYDAASLGLPAKLYCSKPFLYSLDRENDYRYENGALVIDAEAGDIVLDCGAAHGDTTLLFAHKVGERGRVVAFEPNPYMSLVLYENLFLNPGLAARILVQEKLLTRRAGEKLFLSLAGGCSATQEEMQEKNTIAVETTSIDACVEELSLDRVDMIKMDIEGAELAALQGAVRTLARFRPKLAICVYHKPEDFDEIPRFLHELDMGYSFFLNHHSPSAHETVLFARCG